MAAECATGDVVIGSSGGMHESIDMDRADPSYSVYIPLHNEQDIFVTFPRRMITKREWQQFMETLIVMAPGLVVDYVRPQLVFQEAPKTKPQPRSASAERICMCDHSWLHHRESGTGTCEACGKCLEFTENVGLPT